MTKIGIIGILLALMIVSMSVNADCIQGWYCQDNEHRALRIFDCSWAFVTYCQNGCSNGECLPAQNSAPTIPTVELTPSNPDAGDNLTCEAHSTDPNGYQAIEYEYKWYKNNGYVKTEPLTTSNTVTLDSSYTSAGEEWMCKVRAYDHTTYSNYGYNTVIISGGPACTEGWKCMPQANEVRAYQQSDCSWINEEYCANGCINGQCVGNTNHTPTTPNVYISPSSAFDSDDLTCNFNSTDQDNDSIEYHVTWKKNGGTFRTATTSNNYHTIQDYDTSEGENWECSVRASDEHGAYSEFNEDSVLIGGGSCGFSLKITPDDTFVHMEDNDSLGVQVRLENTSCADYCFDLRGRDDSSYIGTDVSRDEVCLNKGESTYVTMDIETTDARNGTYTVKIEAIKASTTKSASITVKVDDGCSGCSDCDECGSGCDCSSCGNCDETDCLSISATRINVCSGKTNTIRVKISNSSHSVKDVELSASSNTYLASFDDEEIEVDARSYSYVDMDLYVYGDASLGTKYVDVYAKTNGDSRREKVYFTVKECEDSDEDGRFSITMTTSCQSLDKGEDKNIAFTVKNLTNEDITVNLQAVADLPTEIQSSIDLGPNKSKRLEFNVEARESDDTGKHYVKLYGWTSSLRVEKKVCVNVGKEHKSVVTVQENKLGITQCENNVFVLLIENQGDYKEDYEIEISNSTKAKITLSDDDFSLEAGKGKEVFVNVDVPLEMSEGDYWFDVIVTNGETFTKRLYFNVVKPNAPVPSIVELASYPSKVVLYPGEEKVVDLSVTNLADYTINDVSIEWFLPEFMSAENSLISIKGKETTIIEQGIFANESAEPGIYTGTVKMKVDDKEISKKVSIVILDPNTETTPEEGKTDEKGLFAPLAGLISLGGATGIGLIILLIIVIVMVALKGVIESDTDVSRPVWYRR